MDILLIEDNLSIIKGLRYAFEKSNYNLIALTKIKDAICYLESQRPDLIILDVMLPDGNGFAFYENLVASLAIPTIFLTAKDDEDDIVKGLKIGAEDYITKPFSTKELLVRIEKILMRTKKGNIITIDDLTFDSDRLTLYKNEQKIELTSLELKIVNLLFTNINKVVTRNMILEKIWEWTGNDVDDHTITVYLQRIRGKIGSNIIATVKGIGYRIDGK